jgi:ribose/xylose/arabinose/galactoside ABC-type transport system permease subunit
MKKLMIMGGLIGFLIGVVFGFVEGVAWPTLFVRASVATLTAGLLLRWWGQLWLRSLKESYDQRLALEPQVQPSVRHDLKK